MELLMLCLAVAYMVGGKHHKDIAQSAYKAGKEPPGLAKARLRHESGGGRVKPRRGGSTAPSGPGALRLRVADRWARSCDKAKIKGEDRLNRWKQWYAEQAPQRDTQWRERQSKRLQKATERTEKWQGRWTRAKDTAHVATGGRRRDEKQAWAENTRRDNDATPEAKQDKTEAEAATKGLHTGANSPARPESVDNEFQPPAGVDEPKPTGATPADAAKATAGAAATSTTNPETTGATSVYQDGVAELHNHADEVEGYMNAISQLGDEMAGVGWGAEVHGPLTDMRHSLQQVLGQYRDLAERIQQQGDNVNDAYDNAPWAPDRAVLVQ